MMLHRTEPLHIEFYCNKLSLAKKQEDYVRSKLDNLKKYAGRVADESTQCRVEFRENKLKSEGNRIYCEVTLYVPQAVIRAEVTGSKVEEAFDLALDKLRRQIERYKSRWNNWNKKEEKRIRGLKVGDIPSVLRKETDSQFEEEEADAFGMPARIVRRKTSHIATMGEGAAIEQMELLGHDFFLFRSSDTDCLSVVYKRGDGTYGLLEPKGLS